jgi:type II secretory pathway component GspD/PulD (secretin)
MMRTTIVVAALCVGGIARAQDATLEVKTVELKQLKPAEAAKLLNPYIVNRTSGGVYDVSDKLPIITIKDVPSNIARLEQVLARYDRSPATIRLVFQLIEADTGPRLVNASNPSRVPMDLDSTLRSVLKFPAYRLLSQGIASVGELTEASQQMGEAGDGMVYKLLTRVGSIRTSGGTEGTVKLEVQLWREGLPRPGNERTSQEWIISTTVDVPLGNTVVLGTAATRTKGVALILAVRPELVSTGK